MEFSDVTSQDDIERYIKQWPEWEEAFRDAEFEIRQITGRMPPGVVDARRVPSGHGDPTGDQATEIIEHREAQRQAVEQMEPVVQAFRKLSREERNVVILRCIEGVSMTRITSWLPMSRGTVYHRWDSARQTIWDVWQELKREEGEDAA